MPFHKRADLVLGMSLAEIMLLVLFAVLLVYVADIVQSGGQDPSLSNEQLQEQVQKLKKDLEEKIQTVRQLEQERRAQELRLEAFRKMVGAKSTNPADIKTGITNLKRGHPVCFKENTLVEVKMVRGVESLGIIGDLPSNVTLPLSKGGQSTDPSVIDATLLVIYKYSQKEQCRFDYRLQYVSDTDYRHARERFEKKYFYPEKQIKLP